MGGVLVALVGGTVVGSSTDGPDLFPSPPPGTGRSIPTGRQAEATARCNGPGRFPDAAATPAEPRSTAPATPAATSALRERWVASEIAEGARRASLAATMAAT